MPLDSVSGWASKIIGILEKIDHVTPLLCNLFACPYEQDTFLQIYYVIQQAISLSSAFIYSFLFHHSRPHSLLLTTKTISLDMKYTLPGSPPSQLSPPSPPSFFSEEKGKKTSFQDAL